MFKILRFDALFVLERSEASDTKIDTQKGELVVMNRCDDMEFLCVLKV